MSLIRRKAYNHFKQAWIKGNRHLGLPDKVGVDLVDKILQEKLAKNIYKTVSYDVVLNNLPQGAYVSLQKETESGDNT